MIPKNEHPRPQWKRSDWKNLNGEWEFEFDFGNSGVSREMFKNDKVYSKQIEVPFCPESKLSGIEYKDFMKDWKEVKKSVALWKKFNIAY